MAVKNFKEFEPKNPDIDPYGEEIFDNNFNMDDIKIVSGDNVDDIAESFIDALAEFGIHVYEDPQSPDYPTYFLSKVELTGDQVEAVSRNMWGEDDEFSDED